MQRDKEIFNGAGQRISYLTLIKIINDKIYVIIFKSFCNLYSFIYEV